MPFAPICRALERRTLLRGTTTDWLRWIAQVAGAEDFDREQFVLFRRAFLQKEDRPATHVFCPQCHCYHEVFIWSVEKITALRRELYPEDHAALNQPIVLVSSCTSSSQPNVGVPMAVEQHGWPSITASCTCDDDPGCPDMELTPADLEVW